MKREKCEKRRNIRVICVGIWRSGRGLGDEE